MINDQLVSFELTTVIGSLFLSVTGQKHFTVLSVSVCYFKDENVSSIKNCKCYWKNIPIPE